MFSENSNIAFIGAGKIAYSLVAALSKAGFKIAAVISSNKNSAGNLAKKFKILISSDNLKFLTKDIKIFFITVPDTQIKKVANSISKLNLDFKNSLFIHVSGALDVSELKSLKKKKANIASFHIMQTFPSKKVVVIKNCSAAIEAENEKVKNLLNKLALKLKLNPFYVSSGNKIYYHLAGVFASNFLVGNLFNAEKIFKTSNDKMDFFEVFNSILSSTINNVKAFGTSKALSGPIERGDYETIEKHLKALKKKNKALLMNYAVQSLSLLKVTKSKNGKINNEQAKIGKLLTKTLNSIRS